jgi:uncharacterized protein (TIGR03437 family)
MKTCSTLALLFVSAHLAMAQGPSTCRAAIVAQDLRDGSLAELLGDVTLECSGGGAGRLDVLVLADSPFANRDYSPEIDPAWGLTDALLLAGDPAPDKQVPCVLANSNATCSATGGFNVFQGRRLQDNLIAFQSIPYSGERLRIVNLRASVLKQAPGLHLLVYSGGRAINVTNGTLTLPSVQARPSVAVQLADGSPAGASGLVLARSQLPLGDPDALRTFQVKVTESSANGFRRRNLGANSADPGFLVSQASPGAVYGTETGFYNAAFPDRYGLNSTSLADSGTRIKVEFTDIPRGLLVWATVRDTSTAGTPVKALLTYGNPDGSGSFSRVSPLVSNYSSLFIENGTATAIWEVVSADPARIEALVFSFAVSALDGSPALGTANMRISLAPNGPAGAYPSFAPSATKVAAFKIANAAETPPLIVVSAATLTGPNVSPDSIATAMGTGLADSPLAAVGAPVATLGDVTVSVTDSTGTESRALLYFAGPTQVNFVVPSGLAPGPALIRILRKGVLAASGSVTIEPVAPGLFSADGDPASVASGVVLRIGESALPPAPLAQVTGGQWAPADITFGAEGDLVYLSLYGTGLRYRSSIENVTAVIGGQSVPVVYAAAGTAGSGMDQVNLGPIPAFRFRGKGDLTVRLSVDAKPTNELKIRFGQ